VKKLPSINKTTNIVEQDHTATDINAKLLEKEVRQNAKKRMMKCQ